MHTPWGDLPLADAHLHFFSHRFFSLLAAQKQTGLDSVYDTLGWERPAEEPVLFANRWIQELDLHGVDQAMLIASLPGDVESVAAAVTAHPRRFRGAAMVNPLDPAAASQLQAPLTMLCLFPAMHGYPIQHEAVKHLIQSQPHLRVFVHCGHLSVGVRGKLGLPSNFSHQYSNPLHLIPLALEFPHTNFVIPHFGSGLWQETLSVAQTCPNVYLDTSSSNSWMDSQQPPVNLATVFRETLAITGPHRLLFGSDSSFFPRGWNASVATAQIAALQSLSVKREVARQVLVENFNKFCEN